MSNTARNDASIARILLWPGDAAARVLGIDEPDGYMLFRMFVNLTVYGKVGILMGLMIA